MATQPFRAAKLVGVNTTGGGGGAALMPCGWPMQSLTPDMAMQSLLSGICTKVRSRECSREACRLGGTRHPCRPEGGGRFSPQLGFRQAPQATQAHMTRQQGHCAGQGCCACLPTSTTLQMHQRVLQMDYPAPHWPPCHEALWCLLTYPAGVCSITFSLVAEHARACVLIATTLQK